MMLDICHVLTKVARLITESDGTSPNGYGFVLEEFRDNLKELARDPSQLDKFFDIYCIKAESKGPVTT